MTGYWRGWMIERLLRREVMEVPPYVPGKSAGEIAERFGIPEENIVKLASNENPLGVPPAAVEALRRAAEEVNLYPEPFADELRRALAGYLGVPEECILVGNGSDDLLEQCAKAFLTPKDSAVLTPPTFSYYRILVQMYGSRCVEVPMVEGEEEYAFPESLPEAASGAKLVFLCSPNNPTGNVVHRSLLEELLELETVVVLDEAYAEFAGESFAPLVRHHENLVVTRTFSKAFGLAGVRVGYCLASEELVGYLARLRQPFSVSLLAQVAALAALRDEPFLRRSVEMVREGREYLGGELRRLGARVYASRANFLLFRTPRGDLPEELLKRGVIVRGCRSFGLDDTYVRVSVGTPEQNRRFVEALEEVILGG